MAEDLPSEFDVVVVGTGLSIIYKIETNYRSFDILLQYVMLIL